MKSFNAGKLVKKYQYSCFMPTAINRQFKIEDSDILLSLSRADHLLGELNAYSDLVPDIDFFIRMHVFKEATDSSLIEGTRTELDEVFLQEDEIVPERRDDWKEVQNYIKAMNFAIKKLEKLPLSIRLLKDAHKVLLSGARGETKRLGEIRTSQNWIGGSSLNDAFFIPPHKDELPNLLSDLEFFWDGSEHEIKLPELFKIALSHYQFETIHPFLDGNGRIGRLLITLYLIDKEILSKPVLYLSDFFAKNKGAYYEALTVVRHSHNLKHWIQFFLNGVIETATHSKISFQKIIHLKNQCENKVATLGKRSLQGKNFLEKLYGQPIVKINQVAKSLDTTHQSANSLVKKFVELDILQELTGHGKNRIFSFFEYLEIFKR